jgi:hypothetical protein
VKGSALDGCPEATSSNFKTARQQCTPTGVCFKCNQTRHWAKNCPSPCLLPEPCLQCSQSGHRRIDCPSWSLQGRSVSHSHSQQIEVLTDHLGLAAEDWYGRGILAPFKITWEEPRLIIQVAGSPQSPTWCYLTFQISFILHKSPWWDWMVPSNSQKRKTVLFKI